MDRQSSVTKATLMVFSSMAFLQIMGGSFCDLTMCGRVVSLGPLLPALFSERTRNSYFMLVVRPSTLPMLVLAGFTYTHSVSSSIHSCQIDIITPNVMSISGLTLGPSCHSSSVLETLWSHFLNGSV